MTKRYFSFILLFTSCFVFFSCESDDNYVPEPVLVSPVVFDIETVPYQTLSEYNLFDGEMKDLNPVYGVLPYGLNNALFSDYSKKKRFVWMPEDVSANYQGDNEILNFPVGTVLVKNFYYNNVLPESITRIIETRLMIHKNEGWVFANYVWNDTQTEATFDLNGSITPFDWIQNNVTKSVNYRIPAGPECHTCHKTGDISIPIGPKPRNMNSDFSYGNETKNQLQKWTEMGYLDANYPDNITSLVSWDDESQPLGLRARAYLDINCAHCHADQAHCAYRPVRFNFDSTSDSSNLGVCIEPDTEIGSGQAYIVTPSNHLSSVMYYRISSVEESERMPLLGRTIVHEEGIELIQEWIVSLTGRCE